MSVQHRATYEARAGAAAEHIHELEVALHDARIVRDGLIVEGIDAGLSHRYVAVANQVSGGQVHRVLATPRAS